MGTSISIDKHVSSLDDILEMPASYFEKIKFESKISSDITQHLKVNIFQMNYKFRFGGSQRTKENLKMSRAAQCSCIISKTVDSFSLRKKLTCYCSSINLELKVI